MKEAAARLLMLAVGILLVDQDAIRIGDKIVSYFGGPDNTREAAELWYSSLAEQIENDGDVPNNDVKAAMMVSAISLGYALCKLEIKGRRLLGYEASP